ncbi:MAG TPA: DUF1385 domain-containing protein [Terriglobales bacterium]|nr:DUF1385 domain-containing protein [Terriglobales bacterium]
MSYWRQFARFFAATQLLPALESGEETLVGGQAVLEGVMMRSPHAFAVAVRKPSGAVVCHAEPLERPSEKHKWMGWPLVRGVMTLGQAMMLGFRALRISVDAALEQIAEDEGKKKLEISGWVAAVNLLFSLGFFIVMYKFVPLLAATELKRVNPMFGNHFIFNLTDGVIRIAIFLLFLWGISRMRDIARLFEYHGAEHKTVFAFESGEPVTVEAAQKYVTWHPRCGTSFLITVMLISIVIYTLAPVASAAPSNATGLRQIFDHLFWMRFALRLALLPVIAGLSYEIIRYAAKQRGAKTLFTLLTAPGLWLQRITTRPPDNDEVQCAIMALDQAMELEKQHGGELVLA